MNIIFDHDRYISLVCDLTRPLLWLTPELWQRAASYLSWGSPLGPWFIVNGYDPLANPAVRDSPVLVVEGRWVRWPEKVFALVFRSLRSEFLCGKNPDSWRYIIKKYPALFPGSRRIWWRRVQSLSVLFRDPERSFEPTKFPARSPRRCTWRWL